VRLPSQHHLQAFHGRLADRQRPCYRFLALGVPLLPFATIPLELLHLVSVLSRLLSPMFLSR
jgi:hypothetical protein